VSRRLPYTAPLGCGLIYPTGLHSTVEALPMKMFHSFFIRSAVIPYIDRMVTCASVKFPCARPIGFSSTCMTYITSRNNSHENDEKEYGIPNQKSIYPIHLGHQVGHQVGCLGQSVLYSIHGIQWERSPRESGVV